MDESVEYLTSLHRNGNRTPVQRLLAEGCGLSKAMNLNQRGIDLIRQCEGCKLEVYKDVAGLPTIGIGHLIKPGEKFDKLTQEQAEELLRRDLAPVVKDLKELIKVQLNDNQFSALVSLAYNIGVGAFKESTLLRKLNAGNIEGAEVEFLRWNRAAGRVVDGLTTRRLLEQMLFTLPV
jgi:GH24 family phage-related lysozyme (muramidase)